mmetsp:Transcript_59687/g.81577  ORF Transcript_59687/g.81577 Transcript_59687/m.81577 type:complete len:103 (-) Transcript_59687:113-421(-)
MASFLVVALVAPFAQAWSGLPTRTHSRILPILRDSVKSPNPEPSILTVDLSDDGSNVIKFETGVIGKQANGLVSCGGASRPLRTSLERTSYQNPFAHPPNPP